MTFVLFCAIILNMRDIRAIRQIVEDLKEVKKNYRYSFKELAEMFHVDTKTIGQWFNKESIPRPVYIPMIKKLVEISKEKKAKKL